MFVHVTRFSHALAPVFCAVLLAFFVAACGGGSGSSSTPTPSPTQAQPTPTTPPSSLTTYTDSGHGFTIGYPNGWKVEKSGNRVTFTDPTGIYVLGIVVTPDPNGLAKADTFADAEISALKATLKNSKTESVPPTASVAGESWVQKAISGTAEQNGQQVQLEAVLLTNNHPANAPNTNNFTIFYTTAQQLLSNATSSYFQPMLNSFKFTA